MTLPPAKVGYKGQSYRIIAEQEQADGTWKKVRVGWTETGNIDGIHANPSFRNAYIEVVEDKGLEGTPDDPWKGQ